MTPSIVTHTFLICYKQLPSQQVNSLEPSNKNLPAEVTQLTQVDTSQTGGMEGTQRNNGGAPRSLDEENENCLDSMETKVIQYAAFL